MGEKSQRRRTVGYSHCLGSYKLQTLPELGNRLKNAFMIVKSRRINMDMLELSPLGQEYPQIWRGALAKAPCERQKCRNTLTNYLTTAYHVPDVLIQVRPEPGSMPDGRAMGGLMEYAREMVSR